MKSINITGKKFNRLTGVKYVDTRNKKQYWLFKCDCGKNSITNKANVMRGATKSCGCMNTETSIKNILSKKCRVNGKISVTTHGMTRTRFYNIWCSIMHRCNNHKSENYYLYGGRGIKYEWKSFDEFKDDMYKSYLLHVDEFGEKQTTIDRINSDGNYYRDNCRWATMGEQANNKRSTKWINYNGKNYTISQLAKEHNLPYKILWQRIKRGESVYDYINS